MYFPDISHYHPVSDWAKVKENCVALISKATEGQTLVDSTLDDFISGCEANKIPYWLYTYLVKGDEVKQVDFLIETCKDKVGSYFVGYILDVEAGNSEDNIIDALDELDKFCDKYMIYTYYSNSFSYESALSCRPSNCAWWEARYGKNNGEDTSEDYPPHDGCDLHQYTSVGSVPGIYGNCDLNRFTGTLDEEWFTNSDITIIETKEITGDVTVTTTTVKDGKQGEYVKGCQILLNGWGYSCGSVDGICGTKTVSAIKSFQKAKSLSVDGICGKNTWNRLVNG